MFIGAQFLEQIKGQEALNEEFLIPRPAFDAIAEEYDGLLEEVDDWKEPLALLQDKYMRALAETENVRRRSQKQIEDAKHFAIQSFCKDLLEVADILDLACATVKKEDIETNEHLSNLFKGIEMTKTVLEKAFAKHGLGKAKFAPGYVAEVVKIGYSLKGRPIRAAKVGVVQSV
ncbi:unnamed protein product [Dracunculus medinensis]|uniref:Nucleotide pyrophosphohydrolase n=1 Tax=Dracunculus medinensis TaxID=318479 RepID=A0A158Q6N1_DRAME|nr:unnamed protein product [Dracunculus medinensis]